MRKVITPYIARAMFSQQSLSRRRSKVEQKRKRQKKPHKVTVYLRINDAYSYVLLQVLKQLEQRFSIEYDFRTVLNLQQDMFPAPNLWDQNAFSDCLHLSQVYNEYLKFPTEPPRLSPEYESKVTAQLLHSELQSGYLDNAMLLFRAFWENDQDSLNKSLNPAITRNVECYSQHLKANEARLQQNGHYLSATMHYGGEWYWGINRIQYLEHRLGELGVGRDGKPNVIFNRSHLNFCQLRSESEIKLTRKTPHAGSSIEMFLSIRSPYSYIGLIRAKQLADHYNVPLIVKPVLPMVMRRMQVPKRKSRYIALDTAREANQYGIPFGFIADPLGKGVENTYALFNYAKSQKKEVAYLKSVARGVWSEGIRADTEKGLSKLVIRAGLNWKEAKAHLRSEDWRDWAQDNLAELYSLGQWGVPCFKFREVVVFGQDRLDRIELAIARTIIS